MNNYKKLLILFTLSLTACGNKVSSSSSTFEESSSNRPSSTVSSSGVTSSSSTVSSSSTNSSTSSSSTGIVDERPNDYIDDLVGEYYSKEGVLIVSEDEVIFNEESLKPYKYSMEVFEEEINYVNKRVTHAVTYLKNGSDEYRIYFSGDGKYQLAFEKKVNDKFETISKFMPSIEEFSGSYSAYGDGNEYNMLFNISNSFNSYYGHFDMSYYGLFAGFVPDFYYIDSYKAYLDDELKTLVSICDYADNYEYYCLVASSDEENPGLIDYYYYNEDKYYQFYYDPLVLSVNYFADDSKIEYPVLDVDNKSLTISDVTYTYEMSYESGRGEVITLTSDSNNVKVYPNAYGIDWEENGKITNYVVDYIDSIMGSYSYEGIDFSFDYNDNFELEVKINSEVKEFEYAVYNNKKAVKVEIEGVNYYFAPFKAQVALLVNNGNDEVFFVNKDVYASLYATTFVNKVNDGYKEVTITEDFLVSYSGKIIQGNLYYNPAIEYPYIGFNYDGETYTFGILEESIGAFYLSYDSITEYYFTIEQVKNIYGSYTKHHELDLDVNKYKMDYFGEVVDYTIEPYYFEYQFTYLTSITFKTSEKDVVAFYSNEMIALDEYDKEGNVNTYSFIKTKYFDELVGEYYLDGTFGPEKFKLTNDGHFYADTMNATNDGLEYDVEYDYTLQMTIDSSYNPVPSIIFNVNEVSGIQLIKVGHTLVLGGSVYTAKYFFDIHGVYVDENNTNVIEVREDSIFVNGVEKVITNVNYDEYGTYIMANDVTYTFMNYDGVIYVSSDENYYTEYSKVEFDFDSLVGSYTYNSTTYTLSKAKIPMTNIEYGYLLNDGFMNYTSYGFTMRNGYVAMVFTVGLNTIYIYNNGVENVIDVVEPGLPPLPPPPPPAPPLP